MRQKKTKEMLDYWMELYSIAGNGPHNAGRHVWPDRSDVQPSECRTLLSDMFILEINEGQCNYRLAGTRLCSLFGRELKNEEFSTTFIPSDQMSAASWPHQLGTDGFVILLCTVGETEHGERVNIETLMLPLSHHGGNGARVLGISATCEQPHWLGTTPLVQQTIKSARVLHPWDDMKSESLQSALDNRALETPLLFPRKQLGRQIPPLQATEDPFLTENEITGGFRPRKKFGHLQVIDGGKSQQ